MYRNKSTDAATKCIASCIGADPPPKLSSPSTPMVYNGKDMPVMCIDKDIGQFYGIGDWGGSVAGGGTWTNPGKCAGLADMMKLQEANNYTLDYDKFLHLFEEQWPPANLRRCDNQDHWGQKLVADQMKQKAEELKTKGKTLDFVLNAGDNFYPGGVNTQCGQFGDNIPWDPSGQFVGMWSNIYLVGALKEAPWISSLGNHDYGGRSHHTGWDVQVFFTWKHAQWFLPAQYYTQLIQYQDFAIKVFVLDSNFMDCCDDPNHRICQGGGDCFGITDSSCVKMLNDNWAKGLEMLENGLKNSKAEWHIILTHFPGQSIAGQPKIAELDNKYGIDLIFSGHAHYQGYDGQGKIKVIVSGGGGGVTTDAGNCPLCPGYGFVQFGISATEMNFQMWNWNGHLNEEHKLHPKGRSLRGQTSQEAIQYT